MNEASMRVVSLAAGLLLGVMFYGGLWWTVRRALWSLHPGLWFVVSLFLRTIITLTGIYVVSGGDWVRIMLCLFGFSFARPIITHLTRAMGDDKIRTMGQDGHAPEP